LAAGFARDQEAQFVWLRGVSAARYRRYREIIAKAKGGTSPSEVDALFALHVTTELALE